MSIPEENFVAIEAFYKMREALEEKVRFNLRC
ncbi:hypothetical protein J2S09_000786 [Bacillus fengqiuensis]|nr:hypothetical protein [Bacillus fengqiuensis]